MRLPDAPIPAPSRRGTRGAERTFGGISSGTHPKRPGVYPDDAALAAEGLAIGEAALLRARAAEACAFCGVPTLDPRASEETKRQWLRAYHPIQASPSLAGSAAAQPDAEHTVRDRLQRAVWDAQLEAAMAIPEPVLGEVVACMSGELRAFAQEQFVFAICGRCQHGDGAESDYDASAILERYVRVAFDGNRAAAELQATWRLVTELASIIASQARRLQQVG